MAENIYTKAYPIYLPLSVCMALKRLRHKKLILHGEVQDVCRAAVEDLIQRTYKASKITNATINEDLEDNRQNESSESAFVLKEPQPTAKISQEGRG